MVKQSVALMGKIFTSERFGRPQVFAGILLLTFIAQCAWLVEHEHSGKVSTSAEEFDRLEEGLGQWHGRGIAGTAVVSNQSARSIQTSSGRFDLYHSPLWYLIASAPVAPLDIAPEHWLWLSLTRAPYVLIGALLGASLWYVSRRLYGNAGGYVALALYCFSPAAIRGSALWLSSPNIGGVWGTFGAVFTAIAVSHTLYAPREVVLWNWRRTILLGVSLALAIGSHFALVIVIPVLLAFMLYLAPERKAAASTIFTAACGVAVVLLFASYFCHPRAFIDGLMHAHWLDANWRAARMPGAYRQVIKEVAQSGPVLLLLVPASVAIFCVWPRTRYFGNIAPLIVAALFLVLRVFSPHESGSVFSMAAFVFLLVFVSGIAADLLETRWRELFYAVITGLVAANALWNLLGIARISR